MKDFNSKQQKKKCYFCACLLLSQFFGNLAMFLCGNSSAENVPVLVQLSETCSLLTRRASLMLHWMLRWPRKVWRGIGEHLCQARGGSVLPLQGDCMNRGETPASSRAVLPTGISQRHFSQN